MTIIAIVNIEDSWTATLRFSTSEISQGSERLIPENAINEYNINTSQYIPKFLMDNFESNENQKLKKQKKQLAARKSNRTYSLQFTHDLLNTAELI